MVELRNHTPHDVTIELADGTRATLPAMAPTPRCVIVRAETGLLTADIGLVRTTRTRRERVVVDLPEQEDGVLLIVSLPVAEASPDRDDLCFPDDQIRDDQQRVIGCRALGQPAR